MCAEKNLLGCGCSGGGLLAEEEDNGRAFITNSVALSFETGNIQMAGWLIVKWARSSSYLSETTIPHFTYLCKVIRNYSEIILVSPMKVDSFY